MFWGEGGNFCPSDLLPQTFLQTSLTPSPKGQDIRRLHGVSGRSGRGSDTFPRRNRFFLEAPSWHQGVAQLSITYS